MIQSETRLWCVLLASATFVLSPLPAMSLDFPEHIGEIKLRDVMWQDLPEQVRGVFVDPKDRIWYQLCHPAQNEDLATVRTIIQREFSRPAPQIFGARPALFEPGGRVWFITHSQKVLLGYDGKELIERHADNEHFFPGNCPNHGRIGRTGYNLFAADTVFLLESHGVLTFSGGEWSYQQMTETPPFKRNTPRFPSICLEQDGKGMTALMPEGENTSLWRWRSGKWSKVLLPDTLELKNLTAIAPWQDGVWLFTKTGIIYHTYKKGVPGDFERLLKNLGDRSFKVREEGTSEMIKFGVSILKHASIALKESEDPEVRMRLKQVIDAVTPTVGQPATFGQYKLGQAQLALCDGNATVYVTAADIIDCGKSLGPGLVIGKRDGTFKAFAASGLPLYWGSSYSEDSGPLVLQSGRRVWLPMCSGGLTSGLLDIEEKKFIATMPDSRVYWLHALRSNGTIFAGRREPGQSGSSPVMFNPSAPDDRNLLESKRVEIVDSDRFCVTSDGVVWAETVDRGICRFDGKEWREVDGITMRGIRGFLPGTDGSVILTTGNSCALVAGDKVVQHGSMRDLISNCAKDIARLFKAGGNIYWMSIAPDDKGNIWLRENRTLSVLAGNQWLEAADALKKAGARTGGVEYLGVCGNGGKVYVTDFLSVHSQGSSQFGEVKNGNISFSKAPHTCESFFMHMNVHDDGGGLWVPGSIRGSGGTCDWITGQLALRITEKGTVQELTNAGWAKLKDLSGNVWLGSIRGQNENLFNIWREEKIVHTVAIPGASERSTLVSDKLGSVFAWTSSGLRHMVAVDPAKPGGYSFGKLYSVKGFEGAELVIKLSSLGFLAVSTYSDSHGGRKYYLYLIKLPK